MTGFVTIVLVIGGSLAAVPPLYLLTLALGACFYSPSSGAIAAASARLTVVIPAHDEALTIAGCVGSLGAQSYPRALYEIVVVADNCRDRTADIARDAGADIVLQRNSHGAVGKGKALRWAIDSILAAEDVPDALVVVDADATVGSDALARLAEAFERGADAAQGDYVVTADADAQAGSQLRAAGFLLVNRVRQAGRSALGLSAFLVGSGMLLSCRLLRSVPWEAFTSTEDIEYSLDLQEAGYKIAYVGEALIQAPTAPTRRSALAQQLRWEGGRTHLMRTRAPRMLRRGVAERRPALIWAAAELLTPPLGVLAAVALSGIALSTGLALAGVCPVWTLAAWVGAAVAIAAYVLVGLRAAGAPWAYYRALTGAPMLVLSKVASARRVLRFRPDSWVRTERAGDQAGEEL